MLIITLTGRLWELFKDEENALQSYNCALKSNAGCVPAMMAIANMLKERDQYGPAIEYYRNITKFEEGNGDVWANLGTHASVSN
jgi:glucose repression mediator protein